MTIPLITLTPLIAVGSPRTSLVMMPLAMALAWYLGWRATRPVRQLRDRLLDAAHDDAAPHLRLGREDEFDELAVALDRLLRQRREDAERYQTFVGDLAHELKSPLAAIQTCSHSLQTPGIDDARVARISRVMRDSCTRMGETLERLLEIARAQHAPLSEATSIDVCQLARGVVDSIDADERYPSVDFDVVGCERVDLLGAAYAIESAIRNLVENAASFAAPNGRVQVAVHQDNGYVHIRVRDTGPGVPPEDQSRVFDRFFTSRGRGTGLGLALVKAVAEAHEGRAWVDAEMNWGAVFHMRFTSVRHQIQTAIA